MGLKYSTQDPTIHTEGWACLPIDKWRKPDGTHCAELFEEVCTKCPNFYLIGLRQDSTFNCRSYEGKSFFLGQAHDQLQDLYLPDRKGFLYFNEALQDLPVIFDTGATVSVSPSREDFIDFVPSSNSLTNITGHSEVSGYGTVKWILYDDAGRKHTIMTPAYYVPEARV